MTDRHEEVAEQDEQSVQFDEKSRQGPAEENEDDARAKGCSALEFLRPCEEDYCLLNADDESETDEEEDLAIRRERVG